MKRSSLAAFTVLLSCSLFVAQSTPNSTAGWASVEGAAQNLTKWFNSMIGSAGDLAATEDKRRLVKRLTDLDKEIYDLEQDKRYVLDTLRMDHIDTARLERATSDIRGKVLTVREALRQAGLTLRQQYRAGGVEVKNQLDQAISERKDWVFNVDTLLATEGKVGLQRKGEAAVNALHDADVSLTKLIDKIEQEGKNTQKKD